MNAHQDVRPAAYHRRGSLIVYRQWSVSLAIVIVLSLSGCVQAPIAPVSWSDASDPSARVAPASYRSVMEGYRSAEPTAPAPWKNRKDEIAPGAKP
jgi:hypothetical protein